VSLSMTTSSDNCALCGFAETEHGPDGLSMCSSYDPVLRPRVFIPPQLGDEQVEASGRAAFKTYDATRDYIVLEVPADEWTVAYLLTLQSGGVVVAEVRVYPTEPAESGPGSWSMESSRVPEGGLTGRRLRKVGVTEHRHHMSEILRIVRKAMGDEAYKAFLGESGMGVEHLSALTAASELSSDRSTRLAQIAGLYVLAVNAGEKSPVAVVAERLGLDRTSVRDQLHDARVGGLLEGSSAGIARGSLTKKATALLEKTTEEE
jgi:hypothetical protein